MDIDRDDAVATVNVRQGVREGGVCGICDPVPDKAVAGGRVDDNILSGMESDTHHRVVSAPELTVTMEGVADGCVIGQIGGWREEEGGIGGGRHPRTVHCRIHHINILNRLDIRSQG